jgi:hypothetical protein
MLVSFLPAVTDIQKNNSFISASIPAEPGVFALAACYIPRWRAASEQSAETLWKVSGRKYQRTHFFAQQKETKEPSPFVRTQFGPFSEPNPGHPDRVRRAYKNAQ